jgi:hypothetical protein
MRTATLPLLVVAALVAPASADARCNRHEDKRSAAIGRALKPGAELFLEGQHPPVRVTRVRFPVAGKKRLKTFHKVVVNDGLEPDLARAWVRSGPLTFQRLAPLAGCKAKGPATRDYSRPQPPPRGADLVLAGYCREGEGPARLASVDDAWTLQGTKLPFCTPLADGALRAHAPPPATLAPWSRTQDLWLVARLPRPPERSVELRLKVSVWAHVDARCNACSPPEDADCTAATTMQSRERTAKVLFDERGFAAVPVWELASLRDERTEHVAVEAVLWTAGEDLARVRRELYWPRCD